MKASKFYNLFGLSKPSANTDLNNIELGVFKHNSEHDDEHAIYRG